MPPRSYDKTFLPLESNPEIFTSLAHNLGLSPSLKFTEVYDLDEVPENEILAYVLAFPTSEGYDEMVEARDQKHYREEDEAEEVEGVHGDESEEVVGEKVLWLRQTIHNACGLYALLHATCNGAARNYIKPNSILQTLHTIPASQHSSFLSTSPSLESLYTTAAKSGDTPTPEEGEEVNWHYTAFVPDPEGKKVVELDGDRWGPLVHDGLNGEAGDDGSGNEGFAVMARRVIKREYFESGEMEGMFSVLALVKETSES